MSVVEKIIELEDCSSDDWVSSRRIVFGEADLLSEKIEDKCVKSYYKIKSNIIVVRSYTTDEPYEYTIFVGKPSEKELNDFENFMKSAIKEGKITPSDKLTIVGEKDVGEKILSSLLDEMKKTYINAFPVGWRIDIKSHLLKEAIGEGR